MVALVGSMLKIASGGDLFTRSLRFTARLISSMLIFFTLFILMASALFDDTPPDLGIILFVLILIPTMVGLIFAWGHERVGGAVAVIGAIGLMLVVFFTSGHNHLQASIMISSPFLISGFLFIFSEKRFKAFKG